MNEGQSQGKFKIHTFCVLCCQLEQEHMYRLEFVGVVKTQFMKTCTEWKASK